MSRRSREWIKNPHRNNVEYIEGVRYFMNFVKNHSPPAIGTCPCPCMKCKNSKRFLFETVEKHLVMFGMERTYDDWCFHGERNDMNVVVDPTPHVIEEDQIQDKIQEEHDGDVGCGLENFVDDAYGVHGMAQASCEGNRGETCVVSGNPFDHGLDHGNKYHEYKRKENEKLYPSCEDDFYKDNLWNELMAKENPEGKLSRVEAWKRAHTKRKTGEVLPCVAKKYVLIEAAEERHKLQASLNGSDGIVSLEEFESDPIAEVYWSEKKKSYCRAISSTSSVKQMKMTRATKTIANQKDVQEFRLWKMEIQNQVTDAMNKFTSMTSAFMNMQQNMLQNMNMQQNQAGGNVTPKTEVASNTAESSCSWYP